jgi:4-amino-4-deoxy-L-arabinose transferase-like glycosyltransferase
VRTDGEWLREFLLVHNVRRFAAPMEGHSGSAFFYYPLVILVGMFPWSMASALVARHAAVTARETVGTRLVICWLAAWLVPFSLAGTKLPGYVWPAYPAVAAAVGLFVADWIRRPSRATDGWMRLAWAFLAVSGIAIGVGLPLATRRIAPGAEWLGLIGLVPIVGAGLAWGCQSLSSRIAASGAWAATACGTVALLLAAGPAGIAHVGGTRQLVSSLPQAGAAVPIASFGAPASAVFYAGRLTPCGSVEELAEPAAAATFISEHPGAHLVVDARYEEQVSAALPRDYGVLRAATSFPTSQQVLLIGPRPHGAEPPARLAAEEAAPRR